VGGAGLQLKDFLRARRQRRGHRKGYAPFPCLSASDPASPADGVAHGNRSHEISCDESPGAAPCDLLPRATRRRVLHLYRLYAVMKAVYDGHTVHQIGKSEGPYSLFLKAVQALEAFEARTQIPVDDKVFVLSVFAYYGKDTWPGMFCQEDVLTYYQRYERRTVHEVVTVAPDSDALLQRVATAWGLSVEEARRRFGPLFADQPEG
jgi:hypothetical protein